MFQRKVIEWLNRIFSAIYAAHKTDFGFKDTHRLKEKGWKNIFCTSRNQKTTGVAMAISDQKSTLSQKL